MEEYHEFSFKAYIDKNAAEISWCPTINCKYVFILDDKNFEFVDTKDFTCPVCKKRYCLNCKVDYHNGQTC